MSVQIVEEISISRVTTEIGYRRTDSIVFDNETASVNGVIFLAVGMTDEEKARAIEILSGVES